MSEIVADASALLATLQRERGHEVVARAISEGAVSSVNLSEVVAKLVDRQMPWPLIQTALAGMRLTVHSFDTDLAFEAGALRGPTRARGLSLGDRACLALAKRLGLPALTTDRGWIGLDIGVEIRVLR